MNKKGILTIVVIIVLVIIGYYAFGSKPSTTVENTTGTPEVKADVPAGVTKDTYAPVTKDSTDNALLGGLRSTSVSVTEDGSKVTLANGKADFTVSGSSAKGSVVMGDIAIPKAVGDRNDIITSLVVTAGTTRTTYVVLFDNTNNVLSDKSYAVIGSGAVITGLRADDIASDGDYVVSVSYKDAKGAHTKLLVVANGEFNLSKSVDF